MTDLFKEAQNILKKKAQGGKNKKPLLDINDIRKIMGMAIADNVLSQDEIKQMLQIRSRYIFTNCTPEAKDLLEKFHEAYLKDTKGEGSNTKTRQSQKNTISSSTNQCGVCSGMGRKVCTSCNGSGGQSQMRVDYDYDNNPIYNSEWISCGYCSGGYVICSNCGGSGTV